MTSVGAGSKTRVDDRFEYIGRRGVDTLKSKEPPKRIRVNDSVAGYGDDSQTGAALKCLISNAGDATRQSEGNEALTIAECVCSNANNSTGQNKRDQTGALIE